MFTLVLGKLPVPCLKSLKLSKLQPEKIMRILHIIADDLDIIFLPVFFFSYSSGQLFYLNGEVTKKDISLSCWYYCWIWTFLQLKIFKQHYFRPEWWQGKENVFSFLKVRYNSKRKQKKIQTTKVFSIFLVLKKRRNSFYSH